MRPRWHRVVRRRREMPGVVTLELDGDPERSGFVPGQFNMLYAFGVGEAAISISGLPGGPLLHTVRDVGAVSRSLCRTRAGELVGVRGPFGMGWQIEEAEGADVVVIAGGVGLAPLRPAVLSLLADRGRYGRLSLLVGARSPELILYERQLRVWARQGADVAVTVDHAEPTWNGQVGVVTDLLARTRFDPSRTLALVCGPEVMMRFSARRLVEAGVPPARIRLSLERNMRCAIGQCGHCQLGPTFVCRDGPVFTYERARPLLAVREL